MFTLPTIKNAEVTDKRVLVRVDFNVAVREAKGQKIIADDFRIRAALPTINHLLTRNAKVILISHLGKGNKEKDGLRFVAEYLEKLLGKKVFFAEDCVGDKAEKSAGGLKGGEVLLLENLRFHPQEEKNDPAFAKQLAGLADLYVNDAFGVCHRSHASVTGVPKLLPSYAGFLLEKEMAVLQRVTDSPSRPLAVIIGGAKISTKIKVIEHFLDIADEVVLGGALANTLLRAKGLEIGRSLFEDGTDGELKRIDLSSPKLHLPLDVVVSTSSAGTEPARICPMEEVRENELILDVGPESLMRFDKIIQSAKMIFWNGPFGLFEHEQFSKGSYFIARSIAISSAYSVVGGGETIAILDKLGLIKDIDHVSTGGGAMLEFLSGKKLPGIEALLNQK